MKHGLLAAGIALVLAALAIALSRAPDGASRKWRWFLGGVLLGLGIASIMRAMQDN